jgi:hypothetical protein
MGTTLLLLDKFYGGNTEYGRKALAILDYWKQSRRTVSDNAYDWNYYFSRTGMLVMDTSILALSIWLIVSVW